MRFTSARLATRIHHVGSAPGDAGAGQKARPVTVRGAAAIVRSLQTVTVTAS
jgi:hypothetical protein